MIRGFESWQSDELINIHVAIEERTIEEEAKKRFSIVSITRSSEQQKTVVRPSMNNESSINQTFFVWLL